MKYSYHFLIYSFLFLFLNACDKPIQEAVVSSEDVISMGLTKPVALNLKIAFVGDSGYGEGFEKVLHLIKKEKADLVLHLGDMAYDEDNPDAPKKWDDLVTRVLGEHYPYLFLIGNHDIRRWNQQHPSGYAAILKKRLEANPNVVCIGEAGVKSYCTYRGLFFVLSGIGTYDTRHEEFIGHALRQAKEYSWRICAWHKNQHDLQVGDKRDDVGWGAYKLCQSFGAMIAMGHEHSYERTRNLSDIGNRKNHHGAFGKPNLLTLGHRKTFSFISGLGGMSLRPYRCRTKHHSWWANIFASNYVLDNGTLKYNDCPQDTSPALSHQPNPYYNYGALFITFNYQSKPHIAKAQFKTVDKLIVDEFDIQTEF